jgi:hypothetical protein
MNGKGLFCSLDKHLVYRFLLQISDGNGILPIQPTKSIIVISADMALVVSKAESNAFQDTSPAFVLAPP